MRRKTPLRRVLMNIEMSVTIIAQVPRAVAFLQGFLRLLRLSLRLLFRSRLGVGEGSVEEGVEECAEGDVGRLARQWEQRGLGHTGRDINLKHLDLLTIPK